MSTVMNELKDRLREARKNAKKTQAQVAEAVGMKQPSYHQLESGRSNASVFLPKIARFLGVDVRWLEQGVLNDQIEEPQLSATQLAQVAFNMVASPNAQMIEIPIYSVKASCGNGCENLYEEITDYMRFDPAWLKMQGITTSPAKLRIIFATEMSMWPSIEPDSMLIVDTSDVDPSALRTGKIYVFQYAYELRVKRVFVSVDGQSIRLCSDNPDKSKFPDEVITPEQAHSISFVGRVVWRGGEM